MITFQTTRRKYPLLCGLACCLCLRAFVHISGDTSHPSIFANQHIGCDAFSLPPSRLRHTRGVYRGGAFGRSGNAGGGNNGGRRPTLHFNHFYDDDSDSNGGFDMNVLQLLWMSTFSDDESNYISEHCECQNGGAHRPNGTLSSTDTSSAACVYLRGGGGVKETGNNPLQKLGSAVSRHIPFRQNKKEQLNLQEQEKLLSITHVTSVCAPSSDLLPLEVITQSSKQANLIGGTLTPETMERTASLINQWYWNQGYVMNSVTGATLVPGKANEGGGKVELKVREVKLAKSRSSVDIRFVDRCDNANTEAGVEIITLPALTNDHQVQNSDSSPQYQKYKLTSGRTRPLKVARMVQLSPGSQFRILPEKWSRLVALPGGTFGGGGGKSAIFSAIHAVQPVPTKDGKDTVNIEILASENKPYVSMEYGVTKSLYSDQWEGELDLKHGNTFGGGEVATLNVRKGKSGNNKSVGKDGVSHSMMKSWGDQLTGGPLNWRMSIKDDAFGGGDSGYDVQIFRDHLGVSGMMNDVKDEQVHEEDCPQRTGGSVRLRLPRQTLPHAVSASFERINQSISAPTASRTQSMASATMNIGPCRCGESFLKRSFHNVRSALSASITAGARWDAASTSSETATVDTKTRPYATGTITSQHIIPLVSYHFGNRDNGTVNFAMRHVLSAASMHLPRHEAIILGLASRVRGYKYNYQSHSLQPQKVVAKQVQRSWKFLQGSSDGQTRPPIAVSKAISGTMEVRVPLHPLSKRDESNLGTEGSLSSILSGDMVLFGDWSISQAQTQSSSHQDQYDTALLRHSSIGIGFRKRVQGIPLKMDACITEHGARGVFFGIGQDFGV